ncbi:uracil phosphoribosyltransferase [Methanothermobacter wolfeii]|uniref:Uracil phosphoribosyltransferase n=1 Tax=Methanothermobacter wolfeii TaxID=145261 RepID=A0ABU8TT61_METWO|nr:uracil phosphoribosyltransferase [Methanothermobacter wolfeii]MDI6702086.1 uracil phosphoribosyltransferase [Methanothermobacter wolfeii]SCM58217.1 Uracil phosphoribosyltransferase {ECO:0000255/HAMAP-Rule:MF_01218} [Methanothermobacter wolfeii]
MRMLKLIDNLIVRETLTSIRRKGVGAADFRRGLSELGRYMAYEFADTLNYRDVEVETPLGVAGGVEISDRERMVVVSILRASLPFSEGVMKVFPEAHHGIIGARRSDEPPFNVSIDYIRMPRLDGRILVVADPMLATGNTMLGILEELGGFGSPDRTVIFNVLSSREGLERVLRRDLEVYTCGVDDKLNDRGYIVPGLGDAGDLAFGRPSECRK